MLEALLKHLRSYGMEDLEFIIINSKLPHSKDKLHELERRVSFAVYQETDEEEVWSVMQGGKDDMFVYDRCGKLTYFVPFPLSILNEYPLVSNAILATYFQSPCGACVQNDNFDTDDFLKNIENLSENSTDVTEGAENYTFTEDFATARDSNETEISEISNDLIYVVNSRNVPSDSFNVTPQADVTQYPYPLNNSADVETERNNDTSYYNNWFRMFFNIKKEPMPTHKAEINSSLEITETFENETTMESNNTSNGKYENYLPHDHGSKNESQHVTKKPIKKSDRCAEADFAVCRNWSKKRLLHAQRCCSLGSEASINVEDPRSCGNFGKRRCKKIQSILKCCIKTAYAETTSTAPLPTETTEIYPVVDSVCCKIVDNGGYQWRICRVSKTGVCNEDEYVEGNPNDINCQNIPCQNETSSEDKKVLKSI